MAADAAGRAACGRELMAVLLQGGCGVAPDRAALLDASLRRLHAPIAPPALRKLAARLSSRRGADVARATLQRTLRKARVRIPDVEGALGAGCQLCRAPHGRRFADASLQRHFAAVFAAAAAGAQSTLSRFDLFHGHWFVAHGVGFGVLLHAREYPQRSAAFDVDLGYCQRHSTLPWDASLVALRNVVYAVPASPPGAPGALAVLHTAPGSLLHEELLAPGVRELHTVYEDDLGVPLGDVNYLHALPHLLPEHRLFVCT